MTKRFLTITELVNLPTDPGTGSAGQLYFNTTDNLFKYHDGVSWKFFSAETFKVYDGGTPTTFAFDNNLDGGQPNKTIFIGIYDGGEI
jgi:hypothetical protein